MDLELNKLVIRTHSHAFGRRNNGGVMVHGTLEIDRVFNEGGFDSKPVKGNRLQTYPNLCLGNLVIWRALEVYFND